MTAQYGEGRGRVHRFSPFKVQSKTTTTLREKSQNPELKQYTIENVQNSNKNYKIHKETKKCDYI